MRPLEKINQQDRRLLILRALAAENDYAIADDVLRLLMSEFAHKVSADVIRSDIAWLVEQGLATASAIESRTIATITERGADVASGAATVPGVRRPRPGE